MVEENAVQILNVYQKLQKSRVELQERKLKKSGKNKYAGFEYYELADFIPAVNEIFNNNGLFSQFNLNGDIATLKVINTENIEEFIEFNTPVVEVEMKGCTKIQGLGALNTYSRRYLYLNALEIVESDVLDSKAGDIEEKQEEITEKVAMAYKLNFGKNKGKTLGELLTSDYGYLEWLRDGENTDDYIKQCLELIMRPQPTKEEQEETLALITKTNMLFDITGTDRDKVYEYYKVKSNSEMSLEQLRELVKVLEKRQK